MDYLHRTRDAWNVIKVTFTNTVTIPVDGEIEWEFKTADHSFQRDLGWDLDSYVSHLFSCIYSNNFPDGPGTTIYCEITSGTPDDPVFVRMKGFNAPVPAGTSR
mmetsp:Transcript_26255/g.4525  ORF Transcript_26255/g.4525 Transcript_26255/m.4525 type:complete len:104 (+) Transcript_26255:893-1204(+)